MKNQEEPENKPKLRPLTIKERQLVMSYQSYCHTIIESMIRRGASKEEMNREADYIDSIL